MQNFLAKLFTFCFHPVLMPILLLITFYFFAPVSFFYNSFSFINILTLFGVIFLYTALFPSVFIYFSYKRKTINDLELSDYTQRPKVYFISSAFYIALAYFMFSKGGILIPTSFLLFIIIINIIGLALLSYKYKISAHMSAIGCTVGLMLMFYLKAYELNLYVPLLISIIISGFLGSARLYLGAHNLFQVTTGYLWGLLTGIFGFIIFFQYAY